jgi:SAM-dependent methyltransferase
MGAAEHGARDVTAKPATAARMYDYYLGGVHNFPADREAAKKIVAAFPDVLEAAQANRAFLRRAVAYLAEGGVTQFLDIGSGIPTQGNVHEIAQRVRPGARVVYVDIDPVAVAESQELLEGNPDATAIRGDLREPKSILTHPAVTGLLDLDQPVALLLFAVLHFVPDDPEAYGLVADLVADLPAGSQVAISHVASELMTRVQGGQTEDPYKTRTATPVKLRSRAEIELFFTRAGLDLVEPGVVWLSEWRPVPDEPDPLAGQPHRSSGWAGVGRKR